MLATRRHTRLPLAHTTLGVITARRYTLAAIATRRHSLAVIDTHRHTSASRQATAVTLTAVTIRRTVSRVDGLS